MRFRAVLAALLVAGLGGCAIPISYAGHTEDFSEVFYGEGTSDGLATRFSITFEPTRVTCQGNGQAMDLFGHWHDDIICADGRTGSWDTYAVDLGHGRGEGSLSTGAKLSVGDGLKGFAETLISQFRQTMAATRGGVQTGMAPPTPEPVSGKAKKLSAAVAAAPPPAPIPPPPPAPAAAPATAPGFPTAPVVTRFPHAAERSDDVAVIIGNADYHRQGKDIPDVKPAYADAEGMRLYAMQGLGIREGNIIFLKDATGAQMTRVFGSDKDYRGQLFDWVKPGKSRVFVYYSGHGAPGAQGASPFLVPTDADAARIELNGYPLKQLYDNLGQLPADRVTVVLEACFSGFSQGGTVMGQASPVYFDVKAPPVPTKLTVITAGAANQVASWEQDGNSGLFTKYFLLGMSGEAGHGGQVGLDDLNHYLKETLTYWARRYYGRDQQAQIITGTAK